MGDLGIIEAAANAFLMFFGIWLTVLGFIAIGIGFIRFLQRRGIIKRSWSLVFSILLVGGMIGGPLVYDYYNQKIYEKQVNSFAQEMREAYPLKSIKEFLIPAQNYLIVEAEIGLPSWHREQIFELSSSEFGIYMSALVNDDIFLPIEDAFSYPYARNKFDEENTIDTLQRGFTDPEHIRHEEFLQSGIDTHLIRRYFSTAGVPEISSIDIVILIEPTPFFRIKSIPAKKFSTWPVLRQDQEEIEEGIIYTPAKYRLSATGGLPMNLIGYRERIEVSDHKLHISEEKIVISKVQEDYLTNILMQRSQCLKNKQEGYNPKLQTCCSRPIHKDVKLTPIEFYQTCY